MKTLENRKVGLRLNAEVTTTFMSNDFYDMRICTKHLSAMFQFIGIIFLKKI